MELTLGELAVRFGCELRGNPAQRVSRVATLATADGHSLCFLADRRYLPQLSTTQAAAVVLAPVHLADCKVNALLHANPHACFARIAQWLYADSDPASGVHASAVIGRNVVIGQRSIIGPLCVLADGVVIGDDCHLRSRVTLERGVQLGDRVLVHAGAVIGADGFGYARDGALSVKVPQVGTVRIGNDVEIGANTTIDRGALDDTVIGNYVKIDNQVQIAHNCTVGDYTVISAQVGLAGSTHLGQRCQIGGQVGFVGHLTVCDDVAVTGATVISKSITAPGVYSGAIPAEPRRAWQRLVGRFKRLDSQAARLAQLERAVGISISDRLDEDTNDD
jgi:UDP-3-O-[3-hydroxymyristoyl] glucosamine N-acyltransferase